MFSYILLAYCCCTLISWWRSLAVSHTHLGLDRKALAMATISASWLIIILLALKFADKVNALSINSDYKFLNKKNVNLIKGMGYKLYPYTVNDENEMKKLISIGVDGIITDYPDKLKNILNYL